MFKQINPKFRFLCNCLIIYVLVGFFSSLVADSHQDFQITSQSDLASQFSRIISLGVAYSAKESLYK